MNATTPQDTGDLLRAIVDDIRIIAHDEVELGKTELKRSARAAAGDAGAIMLGAIVALIGFGMLCVSAVVALDGVIASLAVRLVLMAIVYLVVGGGLAAYFATRLRKDAVPDLSVPAYEARSTVKNLKEAVHHA